MQESRLDYPQVLDRKNKIVTKHSKGVEFLMKKNKVEWIKGYGTLKGGGKIEVRDGDKASRLLKPRTSSSLPVRRPACCPASKPTPERF